MLSIDERPATIALFQEIAAEYTARPCLVDLVPIMGAGVRGMVAGDGDTWRILAHDTMPARRLFHTLLHELGHVIRGDVADVDAETHAQIMQAIGTAGAEFRAAFRDIIEAQGITDAERQAEAEVDAWADELAAIHWPTLQRRLGAAWNEYIRGG